MDVRPGPGPGVSFLARDLMRHEAGESGFGTGPIE